MSKEYRVIEILNDKELIINYGLDDGAKKGNKVRIYSKGSEVIDPLNNKVLGTLDNIKDELEVFIVYDRFSVCRKVVRRQSNFLNPLSGLDITKTEFEPINVNRTQATKKKVIIGGTIEVGDSAKLI
jgi:hypothetical protein